MSKEEQSHISSKTEADAIRADPFRHSRNMRSAIKICGAVGKEKGFRKNKAACAVTMAQAVFLPSGEFAEVAVKHQL